MFTELIAELGVANVEVEEVYTLDDLDTSSSLLKESAKVYGLIFLFNLKQVRQQPPVPKPSSSHWTPPQNLFFAHQVINNACATQAILSVLMNAHAESHLDLGPTLGEFREFSLQLPADMKGLCISNSDRMRTVHNSFSRHESLIDDEQTKRRATKYDDLFHFVAYVPFRGQIYELDGLQEGPIHHGAIAAGQSWLEAVKPVIAQRMETYASSGEIRFSLMSVTTDKRHIYNQLLLSAPENEDLKIKLQMEEDKHARMRKENARRRHNFIPLIFKLLELMASSNSLPPSCQ